MIKDHPIADLFDLATEAELSGLADDIRKNGQIETIDLYEGMILDGRNRYRACVIAGIEPRTWTWDDNGLDPVDYVVGKNLHRRHLTIAQRAAVGVRLLDYEREEALKRMAEGGRSAAPGRPSEKGSPNADTLSKGRAAELAAAKVGVGRTSILAAELIAKESPKTFEKMKRGEISVTAAASEAGIGTGTYTKRKPRPKVSAEQMKDSATASDNVHAAHFYTGLASHVLAAFDQIPKEELDELLIEAHQACKWWQEIIVAIEEQRKETKT